MSFQSSYHLNESQLVFMLNAINFLLDSKTQVIEPTMSDENRTPTMNFVEVSGVHHSGQSSSDGGVSLRSQLRDPKVTSIEVDRRLSEVAGSLSTQLETLIQSVRKLREKINSLFKRERCIWTIESVRSTFRLGDKID